MLSLSNSQRYPVSQQLVGAVFGLLLLGHGAAVLAQTSELPRKTIPYHWSSGVATHLTGPESNLVAAQPGGAEDEAPYYRDTIVIDGVPWVQLHFGDSQLGNRSYIELKSLKDDATQTFDARTLERWENRSAFFNGDAVEIKVFVDPGDEEVQVDISEVIVGELGPSAESICGVDNRSASTEPRVGRIDPIGCTGWVTASGALLTAGHCLEQPGNQVLSFNPPPSLPDGTVQFPSPEDQYSIDQSSFLFENDGIGNDWGIFRVFDNTITGLQPADAQGAFSIRRDLGPTTIRITGFGLDDGSTNQTNQTDTGPNSGSSNQTMRYRTDTRGGNSGSPIVDEATGEAVGIHTHGGCFSNGGNNHGTSFFHSDLWAALVTCVDESNLFQAEGVALGDGSGVHRHPTFIGDVNGDGLEDLLFIGQDWSGAGLNIRTKFSNGSGGWVSSMEVLGDGDGVHKYPALTGDVDGDGKIDLIFVGQGWKGPGLNVRTKLSNGDGTWNAVQEVLKDGPGVHTYPTLTGDVNGDGKTDLIFVGQEWSGTGLNVRTKLSNGDGTWNAVQEVLGDGLGVHTYPTLTGDVDGDGKTDLIFVGQDWSGPGLNIRTKLSNGDGTWTAAHEILGDGSGVHTYPTLTGDVDGDGKTDLVFVGQDWSGSGLNIRTKLSNGDGTWAAAHQILGDGAEVHTYSTLPGDVNGDGKTDLVFVGQDWCGSGLNIRVKESQGDGTWVSRFQVLGDGAGVHRYPALTGRFDNGDSTDLVFVGQGWSGVGLNIRTKFAN